MMIALFVSSCLLAVFGYFTLFFSFFPACWKPCFSDRLYDYMSQKRLMLGMTAIVFPIVFLLVCLWLAQDIGLVFGKAEQESLIAFSLFPLLSALVLLPIKFCVSVIGLIVRRKDPENTLQKKESQGESPNWRFPAYGCGLSGCLIPLVFFIVTGIILAALGDNFHFEYNPAMDGPRTTFFWQGLDWIAFFSTLQVAPFFPIVAALGLINFVFLYHACFPKVSTEAHKVPESSSMEEISPETKIEKRKFSFSSLLLILIVIAPGILIVWINPPVSRYASAPPSCERNLRVISMAISHYYDLFQVENMPSCSVDAVGQPLHSWRVLLLPYLERNELYQQIRLDEPWDSEYNQQFHHAAPTLFQCPELYKNRKWEEQKSLSDYVLMDTTKKSTETQTSPIILMERKTPVNWMDPTQEPISENLQENLGKNHHEKAYVLRKNGTVELVEQVE